MRTRLLPILWACAALGQVTTHPVPAPTTSQATLFAFDDQSIPFRHNLYLTMHRPDKREAPVLRRGEKGTPDEYGACFYGSILHLDGKYRMWYIAYDADAVAALDRRSIRGWRLAYAESTDGIHWTKPNLGLVEYHGNRNNNLVRTEPSVIYALHTVVLHEPDAEPSARFKMMINTKWNNAWTSMPLVSPDGLTWRAANGAKPVDGVFSPEDTVLPPESLEQSGFYKWGGLYHLTGQQVPPWNWFPDGQPGARMMSIFRSPDLLHWSPAKSAAYARDGYRTAKLNDSEEAHLAASVWNRGNVLLGVFGLFHGSTERPDHPIDLGFLISNDGEHFREPQSNFILIPRGWNRPAAWDSAGIIQGQGFENIGDKTYIWFGGWDNDVREVDGHSEVGLATIRRDGFGSLSPKIPGRTAELITCPLEVSGTPVITINADGLSGDSTLRVELLDSRENPIAGYSGTSAGSVTESGIDSRVTWPRGLASIALPVRLRVRFEGAHPEKIRLYSIAIRT